MAMQRILSETASRGTPNQADTVAEMDALTSNLASAIKELQREVSSSEDAKAIRRGRNVLGFCSAVELVIRHGLASTWRNGYSNNPSFWPIAQRISRKEIISDLKSLSNAINDHARARAWIRLAINECGLESYVSVLSQDQDTLTSFYEPWAILRDSENMGKVMMLLAGMSFTMEFDLTVDDPSLQFEPTPVAVSIGDSRNSSTPTMSRRAGEPAAIRQRADSNSSGLGTDATPTLSSSLPITGDFAAATSAVEPPSSPVQTERKKKKKKKKRSTSSTQPPVNLDDMMAGIAAPSESTSPPAVSTSPEPPDAGVASPGLSLISEVAAETIAENPPDTKPQLDDSTPVMTDAGETPKAVLSPSWGQRATTDRPASSTYPTTASQATLDVAPAGADTTDPISPAEPPAIPNSVEASTGSLPDSSSTERADAFAEKSTDGTIELGSDFLESALDYPDDESVSASPHAEHHQESTEKSDTSNAVMPSEQGTPTASTAEDVTDESLAGLTGIEALLAKRKALGMVSDPVPIRSASEVSVEAAPAEPSAPEDAVAEARYSEAQASILELLHEQMREYSELVGEENVAASSASPSQFLSEHSWDVGAMDEEECERIVAAAPLGSFLVRMTSPEDHSDETSQQRNWALYVSEKGRSVKFPIAATEDKSDFSIMGGNYHYPSLEAVVEALKGGDPVLEGGNGRVLRLTTAAHDTAAWHTSTSFSEGGISDAGPEELGIDLDSAATKPVSKQKVAEPEPVTAPLPTDTVQEDDKDSIQKQAVEAPQAVATPEPVRSTKTLTMSQNQEDDFVIVEDHYSKEQSPIPATDESVDELLVRDERLSESLPADHVKFESMTPREKELFLARKAVREQLKIETNRFIKAMDRENEAHVSVSFAGHRLVEFSEAEKPCDVCLKPVTKKFLSNSSTPQAYTCVACKIVVHRKCQQMVSRRCLAASDGDMAVELNICPDNKGLAAQEYKCHDCKVDIGFQGVFAEARVCDYLGRYMCPDCHRMETHVSPARMLLNWDFTPRPVSRRAKEALAILQARPLIDLPRANPRLASHVEEVLEFTRLRQALIKMNEFLKLCRVASGQPDLTGAVSKRSYLSESCRLVSIQDLISIHNGVLNRELKTATANCEKHITKDCVLCQARGSYCELCRSDQLIFPFSPSTSQCKECKSLFHTACWSKAAKCPKCVRLKLYAIKRERKKDPNYLHVDDESND